MKYLMLIAAAAVCTFAAGCSYKSETVVEKPASTRVSNDIFTPAAPTPP